MASHLDNAYTPHNHSHCIAEALKKAHDLCQQKGARLTPLRETVLKLVWQSHQPIGAYDILAALTKQESRPAQPPTVYRALEFLQEQGLVHRLSSINAYVGCTNPRAHANQVHKSGFLICKQCCITIEVEDPVINKVLQRCAKEHGFSLLDASIELTGLCCNCIKEHSLS